MGCAFDMYTTSWNDRSYVLVLFVLCWFVPLLIMFQSYGAIIYRVSYSGARNILFQGSGNLESEEMEGTVADKLSDVSYSSAYLAKKVN